MNTNNDFGLIGLAVMGQNLVLNVASRGYSVSVFNRNPEVTAKFVAAHPGQRLLGAKTLPEFVASLSRPRKIMLMVKAGAPVDEVIAQLLPLLEQGDIVIDGGNSLYTDTERRDAQLSALGLRFVGAGVSGGEEGARKGPAIMPGGPASTWQVLQPIFESIAARVDGQPCVIHIGPGGAGHYVKMVHNGIEYGDMQLICEAYALLQAAGLSNDEMADVFARWNEGDLQSYLIQITAAALRQRDPETGQPVVDLILDSAGQKGTGKWTVMSALDQGTPLTLVSEAVFARFLSSLVGERAAAAKLLPGPAAAFGGDHAALLADLEQAVYAAKVASYAQGYMLMGAAAKTYGWHLNLGGIALPFLKELMEGKDIRLIAVEPLAEMRQVLAVRVPEAEVIAGTAERTGLLDAVTYAVVVAQAFHWFDADRALAEFRRILRPGGRVAALWNLRAPSPFQSDSR